MNFLNGFKTLIGIAGSVILVAMPRLAPELIQSVGNQLYGIAQGAFGLLTALGIIHKVEKAKAAAP